MGLKLGQAAEVGSIGPRYRTNFLVIGTEPMFVDLCRACGTVLRLYVKETNRNWLEH